MGDLPLLQLPDVVALGELRVRHLHHVVVVVDLEELVDDKLVVGLVRVVELGDVLQDLLDLLDTLGRPHP